MRKDTKKSEERGVKREAGRTKPGERYTVNGLPPLSLPTEEHRGKPYTDVTDYFCFKVASFLAMTLFKGWLSLRVLPTDTHK
jgi:hypothetical protein